MLFNLNSIFSSKEQKMFFQNGITQIYNKMLFTLHNELKRCLKRFLQSMNFDSVFKIYILINTT